MLERLVRNVTADTIELSNGVVIEVRSSSFRRLRGLTAVAAVADECSFYFDLSGAESDEAILNAVRPTLATTRRPAYLHFKSVCAARRSLRNFPSALRPEWRSPSARGSRRKSQVQFVATAKRD